MCNDPPFASRACVISAAGCRRYVIYKGYLGTFECTGPIPASSGSGSGDGRCIHDILTIDACTQGHFHKANQMRDLRKAYTSFAALAARATTVAAPGSVRSVGKPIVSTGRWGCGVFGGFPAHKFTQQVLAARLAGVRLRFSTFGQPDGCDTVLEAMTQGKEMSVARAWALLLECDRRDSFEKRWCAGLAEAAAVPRTRAALATAALATAALAAACLVAAAGHE